MHAPFARRLAPLVLAALAAATRSVRAADAGCTPPTPDALRTAIAAAIGKTPGSTSTTLVFSENGLAGRRVTLRDGADYVETTTVGPFRTARGSRHGTAWHQDENGQTILEAADPGHATGDPAVTTIACAAAPLAGYVVSVLDGAGYGSRAYVDSQTYRVYRQDLIAATTVTTTTYDDFRTTGGRTIAWHRHRSDGIAANESDERIVALDAAPLAETELAIPASRALVAFPTGAASVSLPARLERQKFLVRATIGTRGLDLTLDTGDSAGITLDEDVVRALGLRIYGERANTENAGRAPTGRAIVPELRIGALVMRDVVVTTLPHLAFESPGRFKSVGLLGYDFFAGAALRIAYAERSVTAIDLATFAGPAEPAAIRVPVRLALGIPLADVTLGDSLGERFAIDTGASGSLLVFDYFARRHPEALAPPAAAKGGTATMGGVGGRFEVRNYRLERVRFASTDFRDLAASRILGKAYGGTIDGLLGADFLSGFTVYADYRDALFYFVPHS